MYIHIRPWSKFARVLRLPLDSTHFGLRRRWSWYKSFCSCHFVGSGAVLTLCGCGQGKVLVCAPYQNKHPYDAFVLDTRAAWGGHN